MEFPYVMIDISVLNLHRNNISSLVRAFSAIGARVSIEDEIPDSVAGKGLVLPGVGSFAHTIASLDLAGTRKRLMDRVGQSRFTIGICLGMQLFAATSEEGGNSEGLGFIPGHVARLPEAPDGKVPNIGWRHSVATPQAGIPLDISGRFFYHIHSYYMKVADPNDVWATSRHSAIDYPTVVGRGKLVGLQFHPEVSGYDGEEFLADLVRTLA